MSIQKESMGEIEIDLKLWNSLGGIEFENNQVKTKVSITEIYPFQRVCLSDSLSRDVRKISISPKCWNKKITI